MPDVVRPRLISVITPVYGAHRLADAWESLRDQRLPGGWDFEWLVQLDGPADVEVPPDPRVSVSTGRHGGPAIARNLALARARGTVVKVLDADDRLTGGALARDVAVLSAEPEVGWVASAVLDADPTGLTVARPDDPPPGRLARGSVAAAWRSGGHRPPVHPATLCARYDLVVALGGWMALPASEDTGLLLAASTLRDGWFLAEPGLLYRKWPAQATAQPAHHDPAERAARMALIDARVRALDAWRATRSG